MTIGSPATVYSFDNIILPPVVLPASVPNRDVALCSAAGWPPWRSATARSAGLTRSNPVRPPPMWPASAQIRSLLAEQQPCLRRALFRGRQHGHADVNAERRRHAGLALPVRTITARSLRVCDAGLEPASGLRLASATNATITSSKAAGQLMTPGNGHFYICTCSHRTVDR